MYTSTLKERNMILKGGSTNNNNNNNQTVKRVHDQSPSLSLRFQRNPL